MRRIGARAAGSAVALPGPHALARPAIGAWIAGGLRRKAEQRRLFPWLAVAFGTGILVYFAAVDGTPVLAAPLAGAALAVAPIPFLSARPAALALALAVAAGLLGFAAATWRVSQLGASILARTTIGPLTGMIEALDERVDTEPKRGCRGAASDLDRSGRTRTFAGGKTGRAMR